MLYPRYYVLKDITCDSQEDGGGYCDIHKGHWINGQVLCLKVVRLYQRSDTEKLLKLCAREAILWGQLRQPNIVPFYGIYYLDEDQKRVCLVSPWQSNGNIVAYLENNPLVPREPFCSDVARGLEYLHDESIIHGDLKELNILINALGRACIADFGLSVIKSNKTFGFTVTTCVPMGRTNRWAAPELLEDGFSATQASDVWAFGCVCYEILTQLRPFNDCSLDIHVVRKLIRGDLPAPLDDVDIGMRTLIAKLLSVQSPETMQGSPTDGHGFQKAMTQSSLAAVNLIEMWKVFHEQGLVESVKPGTAFKTLIVVHSLAEMSYDAGYEPPQSHSNAVQLALAVVDSLRSETSSPRTQGRKFPEYLPQERSDNLKTFKVGLDDPTRKVLPAALTKYHMDYNSWKNYAMFICYGSSGNRIERCLSFDEKPLLLYQKLKDSGKNPVFMMKHIKGIRSPIVIAQQKHAARKASSVISNDTVVTQGHLKTGSTSKTSQLLRPEVTPLDLSKKSSGEISSGRSDASENGTPTTSENTLVAPGQITIKSESKPTEVQQLNHDTLLGTPSPSGGVSYAIAIYPYMAEQEDELDVLVGDIYNVISRSRGWWIVERDPGGTGVLESGSRPPSKGWVPAGCLLETNVPVLSAIAEANATRSYSSDISGVPAILPHRIVSTSFPGVALMDYIKKGEEEVGLVEGDQLKVFKRYNHWSYAVKQGGDRGWVPSWYIGKLAANSL
ncbi:hypothetical protein NP233_g3440 [Leucocoprinus birnbaumii]|uniref:mitogen-activated protein kinase kinase kinase n=1 Tax=Leucocoprinus birnbaumii TaxID=56174 RepID=A0AAD5YSU4_9AGAR|nr:hypothetical protein NP233_g3440 [Leucocoprinus birnbaumii]